MLRKINQGRLSVPAVMIVLFSLVVGIVSPMFASPVQRGSRGFRKGDALRLIVWQPWGLGDRNNKTIDLDGDYAIDNRGYTFFPLIGDVKVIGHNETTLATELKEKFSAYIQDPVIVVEPLIRVALLGAFRRPGTYLISPDASLWELVDRAGGPDDSSDLPKMFLQRGGRKVREGLLSGFERAFTLEELGVTSGDQLLLPSQNPFTLQDAFDIVRFGLSILNLYLIVTRI